jgi:hypothetical protein
VEGREAAAAEEGPEHDELVAVEGGEVERRRLDLERNVAREGSEVHEDERRLRDEEVEVGGLEEHALVGASAAVPKTNVFSSGLTVSTETSFAANSGANERSVGPFTTTSGKSSGRSGASEFTAMIENRLGMCNRGQVREMREREQVQVPVLASSSRPRQRRQKI